MDKGCATCAYAGTPSYKSPCSECVKSGTFSGWTERTDDTEKTCETCAHFLKDGNEEPCKTCEGVLKWERATESNPIHPAHYTECSLECIDVMLAVFGRKAVTDFCIVNAFKYMWRYEHKNGLEDLQKAERYLAMATTFQTGDTEHETRIIYMQEELEILMRRVNK